MLEDFLLNDLGSGDLHKGPELDRGPSPRSLAIVVKECELYEGSFVLGSDTVYKGILD